MFKKINIDNTDTNSETEFIDNNLIPSCIRYTEQLQLDLNVLNKMRERKDELFYKKAWDCIHDLDIVAQKIRSIPVEYGEINGNKKLHTYFNSGEKANLNFEQIDSSCIHIVLPELIPRRYNPRQHGEYFLEDIEHFKCIYMENFKNYFIENPMFYRERVVLLYKNYYTSSEKVCDDDNYNFKLLTDIIAEVLLVDDNQKCCMKIYDYGIAEKAHTEVYIFPTSKINQYSNLLP